MLRHHARCGQRLPLPADASKFRAKGAGGQRPRESVSQWSQLWLRLSRGSHPQFFAQPSRATHPHMHAGFCPPALGSSSRHTRRHVAASVCVAGLQFCSVDECNRAICDCWSPRAATMDKCKDILKDADYEEDASCAVQVRKAPARPSCCHRVWCSPLPCCSNVLPCTQSYVHVRQLGCGVVVCELCGAPGFFFGLHGPQLVCVRRNRAANNSLCQNHRSIIITIALVHAHTDCHAHAVFIHFFPPPPTHKNQPNARAQTLDRGRRASPERTGTKPWCVLQACLPPPPR